MNPIAELPLASPSNRKLARELGIDIDALAKELDQDCISENDIRRKAGGVVKSEGQVDYWDVDHAQYGPGERVALTRMDQVAAANLSAAQQRIPAVTHHDRADMGAVEKFRKSLIDEGLTRKVKLTALAFHVKALARTLSAYPRFNASLSADGQSLWMKNYVDIGIAVDTPHGLMVPVVRGCDSKGLWQIASDIADLAARAQTRKVRPEEMGGASMSITNLGGIGGQAFTPIVNPPEVAILGITQTSLVPIFDGKTFQPVLMCPLDLSYDHRVINGADAARFVRHYAQLLSDPRRLLL